MEITIGLIFALYNFNITFWNKTISIFPDFPGYFLIYFYFQKGGKNEQAVNRLKVLSIFLSLYSLMMFLSNLLDLRVGIFDTLTNVVIMVVMIVFFYSLTKHFTSKKGLVRLSVGIMVCMLISHLTSFTASPVYLLSTLGYLLAGIFYIFQMNKEIAANQ